MIFGKYTAHDFKMYNGNGLHFKLRRNKGFINYWLAKLDGLSSIAECSEVNLYVDYKDARKGRKIFPMHSVTSDNSAKELLTNYDELKASYRELKLAFQQRNVRS